MTEWLYFHFSFSFFFFFKFYFIFKLYNIVLVLPNFEMNPPQVYFHALEKEMVTHSCVLAWRVPGTGEPGGLPSMELHRVGHD